MKKEILLSVDEFSLVLFYPIDDVCENWIKSAYVMINEFIDKSLIEILLGKVVEMNDKKPQAYSQAFTIEDVPWYFAIAVHETFIHMGILIRFSGQALATYQNEYYKKYGESINVAKFLSMIESPLYKFRLSRIDLTADYKNYEDLSPHSIYSKLKDERYYIVDCKDRHSKRKISAVQNDMTTETFYIGSRTENSQLLLRVYNKKEEQIRTNGFRLQEALQCENWTRFEASFRGSYAHQITEQLKSVNANNDIELSQFIASKICDKYRFTDVSTGEYTDFTKDLLALVCNSDYPALRTENPSNNNLCHSISHILSGSGLLSLIYKCGVIWGNQAEIQFLGIIYEIYKKYYKREFDKNPQIKNWLSKNYSTLSQQKLEDCFISVDLSKVDVAEIVKSLSNNESPFTLNKITSDLENDNTDKNDYNEEISDKEFSKLFI